MKPTRRPGWACDCSKRNALVAATAAVGRRRAVIRGIGAVVIGGRSKVAAAASAIARGPTAASPAFALAVAPQELNVIDDDLVLGAPLARLLVVPLVQLQATFHVERVAFAAILLDEADEVAARVLPCVGLTIDEQRIRVVLPLPGLLV